jgi:hypothetical protein
MRNLLVQSAGLLALVTSAVHAVLGETKVFPRARIEPEWVRRLIRLVWHGFTLAWIAFAVLLVAAPGLDAEAARTWIVATGIVFFAFAASGNAWATRGRHFGWVLLLIVTGLAIAGL